MKIRNKFIMPMIVAVICVSFFIAFIQINETYKTAIQNLKAKAKKLQIL